MSFLRDITGSLVVSAYHGPEVTKVIASLDFAKAVRRDLRARIGRNLYGDVVKYPEENPSPPLSAIRAGVSHLEPFLRTAKAYGLVDHSLSSLSPDSGVNLGRRGVIRPTVVRPHG